jgi:hypothetical protein
MMCHISHDSKELFFVWQLYHHGENIAVNVHIANNSNRTVKKIKVSGKYLSIPIICNIYIV